MTEKESQEAASLLCDEIWWVWRSWSTRQIVDLEIVGSSPTIHPEGALRNGICFAKPGSAQVVKIRLQSSLDLYDVWSISSGGRALDF